MFNAWNVDDRSSFESFSFPFRIVRCNRRSVFNVAISINPIDVNNGRIDFTSGEFTNDDDLRARNSELR